MTYDSAAPRRVDPLADALTYWPVVIVMAIVCGLGLGAYDASQPKVYESKAEILYAPDSNSLVTGATDGSDTSIQRALSTQTSIAVSDAVVDAAIKGLNISRVDFLKHVSVTDSNDDSVITMVVSAPTPAGAMERTQHLATAYTAQTAAESLVGLQRQATSLSSDVAQLETQLSEPQPSNLATALSSQLAALLQKQQDIKAATSAEQGPTQILTSPTLPTAPSSPSTAKGGIEGGGIGIVLGIGLALFLGLVRPPRRTRALRPGPTPTAVPSTLRGVAARLDV